MGRPSMKEQRTEQVLDAFETCVAQYGVHGATLEKIAEEAGLARALIRHNVGNREDLLDALVERFELKYREETAAMMEMLPEEDRIETLIEWMMDPQYAEGHSSRVMGALALSAHEFPGLAERVKGMIGDFVSAIENELTRVYPGRPDGDVKAVAMGITAIYINFDSLLPLGPDSGFRRSSEDAARLLLQRLEAAPRES